METLVINSLGTATEKVVNGTKYLVADAVLIVPGVLNGSQGPGYYPAEENGKNVESWDSIPLTDGHPVLNGKWVDAKTPEVLNAKGLGFVSSSRDDNGKLKAKLWFDVEKTKKINQEIINSLEVGKPIELSTGLKLEREPAIEGANFNGVNYLWTARNYKPDHLAILTKETGACSRAAGCGVLVNQKDCSCEDKTSCSCNVGWYLTSNQMSHSDLHEQLSILLQKRFTQDEPHAWISEVFDGSFIYRQRENIYKLSYTLSGDTVSLGSETPQQVMRKTEFVPIKNEEKILMGKKEQVEKLVANCSVFEESDIPMLMGFADEKIDSLVANQETAAKEKQLLTDLQDKKKETPVENKDTKTEQPSDTPNSLQQFLDSAPAEVSSVINNAMRIEKRERDSIIDKLTSGLEDEDKTRVSNRLEKLGLEELEDLAILNKAQPKKEEKKESVSSFFGRSSGVTNTDQPKFEPFVANTVNFSKKEEAN